MKRQAKSVEAYGRSGLGNKLSGTESKTCFSSSIKILRQM